VTEKRASSAFHKEENVGAEKGAPDSHPAKNKAADRLRKGRFDLHPERSAVGMPGRERREVHEEKILCWVLGGGGGGVGWWVFGVFWGGGGWGGVW